MNFLVTNYPALPYTLASIVSIAMAFLLPAVNPIITLTLSSCFLIATCFLLDNPRFRLIPIVLAFGCLVVFNTQIRLKHYDTVLPQSVVTEQVVITDIQQQTSQRTVCSAYVMSGQFKGREVRFYLGNAKLHVGGTYTFTGRYKPFKNAGYKRWAMAHGLSAQVSLVHKSLVPAADGMDEMPYFIRIQTKWKLLREHLIQSLTKHYSVWRNRTGSCKKLDNTPLATVLASGLGEKSLLTPEIRNIYSLTGTSHLLALSGMHLSIIYILLASLLTLFAFSPFLKTVAQGLVLLMIWLYVFFVGMPVSIIRAATMLTIYTLFSVGHHKNASLNILFFTALIMLLYNPLQLMDIGFQMSFASLFSIFLFAGRLQSFLQIKQLGDSGSSKLMAICGKTVKKTWNKLWSMISVCLVAQLGTAPLSLYYFGIVSPMFLVSNLVAIPLLMTLLSVLCFTILFWNFLSVRTFFIYTLFSIAQLLTTILTTIAGWYQGL